MSEPPEVVQDRSSVHPTGPADPGRRALLRSVGVATLGVGLAGLATPAARAWTAQAASPPDLPADPERHLLDRLTWGARPEDVAELRRVGRAEWLEAQLHPERLPAPPDEPLASHAALLALPRRALHGLERSKRRCERALVEGRLWRAVHHPAQLRERLAVFWLEHFHVPLMGNDNAAELIVYQRTLQELAFGSFRRLLLASARSPAMLEYLDNASSRKEAPNENYARELLELHTLGVDGGYGERDVREVARAFTGWGVDRGTRDGFRFRLGRHDTGAKRVLGRDLPAGRGVEDGLAVLGILADHPSTARYVSTELARHFVRDDPPAPLVDAMVASWRSSGGEIRSVLRAMVDSEAFAASAGRKFRRPFAFLAAALRASGSRVLERRRLEHLFDELGERPFGWPAPDGPPDDAAAWLSTGGLLARWNAAMELTHGATADPDAARALRGDLRSHLRAPRTAGELVAQVAERVFGAPLPPAALAPFVDYASDGAGPDEPVTDALLARKLASLHGLMLASPAFQWT